MFEIEEGDEEYVAWIRTENPDWTEQQIEFFYNLSCLPLNEARAFCKVVIKLADMHPDATTLREITTDEEMLAMYDAELAGRN